MKETNEAFEVIMGYKPNQDRQLMENGIPFRIVELFPKESEILRKLITPPTADEVCEALSEYFGYTVKYYGNSFCYQITEDDRLHAIVSFDSLGTLSFNPCLPPHLITLIGRFYEGLETNKE